LGLGSLLVRGIGFPHSRLDIDRHCTSGLT
jgi:hypothetical protein